MVDRSGARSDKVVHDAARTLEEGGLMPRPTVGHVFERLWADAETVSYGAQVRAYGRYEKVTFGTNKQGWNRTRAELETERIAQQIDRETGCRRGSSRARTASRRRWRRSACRSTRAFGSSPNAGGAPSSSVWTRTRSTITNGGSDTCSGSSIATASARSHPGWSTDSGMSCTSRPRRSAVLRSVPAPRRGGVH